MLQLGYSLHGPSKNSVQAMIRNTLLDLKWIMSRRLRGLQVIT
jgi:hypothetical protein